MRNYKSDAREFTHNVREWHTILSTFNRRNELHRLITWASRKRLVHPLKLYQNRLEDVEKRLFHYRLNSPRLTKLANIAYQTNRLIFPAPRYLPKGSASSYRSRWLTHQTKSHSILFRST